MSCEIYPHFIGCGIQVSIVLKVIFAVCGTTSDGSDPAREQLLEFFLENVL